MYLDTTSKTLEVVLGTASTTNPGEWTADYVDTASGTTFSPANAIGVSNGTTAVTAVGSPAASTVRKVTAFTYYNADTVNATLTVRMFDGTNRRRVMTVTLTPGQSLVYMPEAGWAILPSTVGQIPGTATNDNAAAGNIGEHIIATQSVQQNLTTTTPLSIANITLTPGDWNVWGIIGFFGGTTTTVNTLLATISPNSNTNGTFGTFNRSEITPKGVAPFSVNGMSILIGPNRASVNVNTTYYLTAYADFGTSTCNAIGQIEARRAR